MPRRCRGAFLVGLFAGVAVAADVNPGVVLGPETAEQARGLLPEEILARYRNGEFRHQVVEPRPGTQWTDPAFEAAADANRGRYTVSADGTILDASDRQPDYIFGPPFPDIDRNDPQAGVKLVWNFFYQSYLLGDNRTAVELGWISRHGLDREVRTEVWQRFFDGQPPDRRRPDNPKNYLFQQLVDVQFPADLNGTVALAWRYRGKKEDSTWSYVPALRRVRAASPTNRSDGFLGSDMSQDDGVYFDGKPENFIWKYVGEGEILCPYDRAVIVEGRSDIRALPAGGWRAVMPATPRFGWQSGNADVLAWAPLPERMVLVRRPVHIVEGVPRDPYYLYGKLVLRLEKGTYVGCYNSKSDWRGQVANTYTALRGAWFKVENGPWRPYAAAQFTLSQSFTLDRATVSYPPADGASVPVDSLIPLDPGLFDYATLARWGK